MKSASFVKLALAMTCSVALTCSSLGLAASANSDKNVRQGLPGRRISGGVRGECFNNASQSLIAMTPRNLLGKTAQARPTFWFSLPDTQSPKHISFEIFDASDTAIYSTEMAQIDASGLSKVVLPETAPALNQGENYRWVFSINCENTPDASALEVQGWVRRVDISAAVSEQIASASLQERADLYGEAELWHEQVTTLAERRLAEPASLEAQLAWAALIQSTGLDDYLADGPSETATGITSGVASTSIF